MAGGGVPAAEPCCRRVGDIYGEAVRQCWLNRSRAYPCAGIWGDKLPVELVLLGLVTGCYTSRKQASTRRPPSPVPVELSDSRDLFACWWHCLRLNPGYVLTRLWGTELKGNSSFFVPSLPCLL